MLVCQSCNHQQSEGKFCGKCGGTLVAASTEQEAAVENVAPVEQAAAQQQAATDQTAATAQTVPQQQAAPNETLENLKGDAGVYFEYFKATLKSPSIVFNKGESEFKNGLINIGLFALLFALSLFALTNAITSQMGMFAPDVSFFSTFFGGILVALIGIFVVIALLFVINKLFGSGSSFKTMTSIFGGHLSLSLALVLVTLLLLLVKSVGIGTFLITTSLSLTIGIIPLYIISRLLTNVSKGVDAFYGYLIYIIAIVIAFAIVISILADSFIGNLSSFL